MKTIEERADNFLLSQGLVRGACASQIDYGARCMYDGYIQGATEQKALDKDHFREATQKVIDKACEWIINTYLGDYVTDEYGNGGIGDNVKLAEDFRKAMED